MEARIQTACNDVREIARTSNLPHSNASSQFLDTDPWGQPYRVERIEGKFRAISSGPDMTASHDGTSGDDIWSDMAPTPSDLITIDKQRRIFAALLILLIWLTGSAVYLTMGLRTTKVS
jgi:23S rRNA U2552 (ribose-2'-O)-methylase RlmE/FtsJ